MVIFQFTNTASLPEGDNISHVRKILSFWLNTHTARVAPSELRPSRLLWSFRPGFWMPGMEKLGTIGKHRSILGQAVGLSWRTSRERSYGNVHRSMAILIGFVHGKNISNYKGRMRGAQTNSIRWPLVMGFYWGVPPLEWGTFLKLPLSEPSCRSK